MLDWFSLDRGFEITWAGCIPEWSEHCLGIHEVLNLIPQSENNYFGVLIAIQGIFLFLTTYNFILIKQNIYKLAAP